MYLAFMAVATSGLDYESGDGIGFAYTLTNMRKLKDIFLKKTEKQ